MIDGQNLIEIDNFGVENLVKMKKKCNFAVCLFNINKHIALLFV